jgi:hypothetical protein
MTAETSNARVFQCNAMGDSMCFNAASLDEAKDMLRALCGELPPGMVRWRELDALPDGEEFAADMRA